MKHGYRIIATVSFLTLVIGALVASCSPKHDALEYAYSVAGPNRGELEKVIEHYKADSLKLAAAKFLIENMPGHYSYKKSKEINAYYDIALQLMKSDLTPKQQRDSLLVLSDNRFFGLDRELIQDARIITSDFLINNIDQAFEVWHNERWASHLTFDEFCEWILPYKCVELQSFDSWRDTMRARFSDNISLMDYDDESFDSPFRAVNIIRNEIISKVKPVGMYTRCGYPMRSASTISRMTFGSCSDYVNLGVLTLRSMGIPVIIEETPSWGRYRAGHTWYTLLNDNGDLMRSEWDISSVPGSPFFPYQRIPKVYRRQYAINKERIKYHNESVYQYPFNLFSVDVTDKYFKTTDVSLTVWRTVKLVENFAYIATFNGHSSEWTIIDYGEIKDGKVHFNKMGRNILYLALGFDGQELVPINWPFIIHKDGSVEFIKTDYNCKESVEVRRKYYSSENVVAMRKRILGGMIQAANNPYFHDAATLFTIDSLSIPDKIQIDCVNKYRYWRYLSPEESYGSIAELAFFSEDSIKMEGKPICSDGADYNLAIKAFDGDWLSNFETDSPSGNWVGLDLLKPESVASVRIVPRSDDNDIHPGHNYVLRYWNGVDWDIVGESPATDNSILFDNVPKGALLWLHDWNGGWDERVFRFRSGKIEWW